MVELIDIHAPAARSTNARTCSIRQRGIYRLARRECVLSNVLVLGPESGASISIMDGDMREVWTMPNAFYGSFGMGIGLSHGLIVHIHTAMPNDPVNMSFSWREPDREDV